MAMFSWHFAGVVAIVFATAARYVRTNGASCAHSGRIWAPDRRCHPRRTRVHRLGVLALFRLDAVAVAFTTGLGRRRATVQCENADVSRFIGVLLTINLFGNRAIKWANGTSTVGKAFALGIHCRRGCGSSP